MAVGTERVAYDERGAGCPVVFLGGGGGMDRRQWDTALAALASDHRTIAIDPRGIGGAAPPREPWSPVEDLMAAFSRLAVDRPVVVGLSSAGATALELAAAHAGSLSGVVAVAPLLSGFEFSPAMRERLAAFNAAAGAGREAYLDAMLGDPHFFPSPLAESARRRGRQIMAETYDRLARLDPALMRPLDPPLIRRLDEIALPVLLVVGALDHPEVLRRDRFVLDSLPNATEVVVPSAGHNVPMENPEAFVEAVRPFLRARCASRPGPRDRPASGKPSSGSG